MTPAGRLAPGRACSNRQVRLIDLGERLVEAAAIDGLWQALMLAGALEIAPLRHELLSYEAPSYYGMLVAAYELEGDLSGR